MELPITALYGSIMMLFALVLSAKAGSYRGKSGISVLHGDPTNMELAERVRVHQNFLENAHAIGLKHDNMGHPGRVIGAGGTALMSAAAALYMLWIVIKPMLA